MTTTTQTRISNGWAEAAAPTNRGYCPHCQTQTVAPHWDLVEDDRVIGGIGGQCSGCGQYGLGWITTGAKPLPDDPADHDAFVAGLMAEVEALHQEWAAAERGTIRSRLVRELTTAMSGEDAERTTGSEIEPGVYQDGGVWVAWDFDPADDSETITVAETELGA